ncbi:MAG TPA: ComF family protein [Desulfobacteraceae bacterium]|nr:ComF family protein [Desulfobacteraceae bacterium]
MHTLLAACRELVFPPACLACGRRLPLDRLPLLCDDCHPLMPFIRSPRCPCCGLPYARGEDHLCGVCLAKPYSFSLARAALAYQPPAASLIGALKFQGLMTGVASLANLAVNSPGFRELSAPDLILPVPLHPKRLRRRGFNQALVLARFCFPGRGRIIDAFTLTKISPTVPQTQLSGTERRRNISGSFSVKQPQKVKNKKILLIDDVFTTGSTVNECARILRRAGADRVEIFTLARTI